MTIESTPTGSMTSSTRWTRLGAGLLPTLAAILLPSLLAPLPLEAQEAAAPTMRDFWHVFAAYAIAWALVFGWTISIGRRLRRIEERLER